jgi:hypothetical protein
MTEENAERVATIVMGVAAVAAAVIVLRNPVLRRRAWQISRGLLAASGPWFVAQARQAWAESGTRRSPALPPAAPRQGI